MTVVQQIFKYECRPILVSTAYLLILRSTSVQEGSRKRRFCCNAALPVSMQWSTELCWMERETKDMDTVCCCAFEVEARQIMLSLPPTVLIRKVGTSYIMQEHLYWNNKRCNQGRESWPTQRGKVGLETYISLNSCAGCQIWKWPMEWFLIVTITVLPLKGASFFRTQTFSLQSFCTTKASVGWVWEHNC